MSSRIESKAYHAVDFTTESLVGTIYDDCQFDNCDFSELELLKVEFIDCLIKNCNFSNVKFSESGLKEVRFSNCKFTGAHLQHLNPFLLEMSFHQCNFEYASFYKLACPNTHFVGCNFTQTDFSEAELNNAHFDNCNLSEAIFDRTNLEKADFKTSYNFRIDPNQNWIKGAIFSKETLGGLLTKYRIKIV